MAITDESIYQLKVTLDDIEPPIWRRLLVPAGMTLGDLHIAIQVAMGWTDSHLHRFEGGGRGYGRPDHEDEASVRDERRVLLRDVLGPRGSLVYEYDFGDSWHHLIRAEAVLAREKGGTYPRCSEGARACPPEDCGGAWGYQEMLEAIADSKHERHDEMLEWIGGGFDPEAFDLDGINKRMAGLARRRPRRPTRETPAAARVRPARRAPRSQ